MQNKSFSRRQLFNFGFNAGLVAGIVATIVMILLSITAGGVSLPESLGSTIAQSMPPSVFEYLHQLIGADAKRYLFYGVLIGQCLIFALTGGISNLIANSPRFRRNEASLGLLSWTTGLVIAVVLLLLTGFIFLPLTGAGFFGSLLAIGISSTLLSLAVVGVVFGLLFVFVQNWLVESSLRPQQNAVVTAENAQQRRTLIRNGIIVAGIGAVGVVAWRFITGNASTSSSLSASEALNYKSKITPPQPNYGTIQPVTHLSSEITPADQFYTVSKNLFSDPTVDGNSWHLTINGEVTQPYTLNYSQLTALPLKQQYESLMCISNDVGGSYMGNAQWEGIPLKDILARAGAIKPGATKVVLHAADDYTDSIHLAKALEPTTMLAVRMNGQTLPTQHGYPARLLVPGIYGMKHVKWITQIEVVNTDYQGYWQQSGWSDPAPVRMTSRIDTPFTGTSVSAKKMTYVAGVAFSGNKGISEVDVSFDGGQHWHVATLQKPFSDLTWVLWQISWQPEAGNYTISVRAVDKSGNVQNPQIAPPQPDGSSGYHTIQVTVA